MNREPKTNWGFLSKYDQVIKGLYIGLVNYKGDESFRPAELLNDSSFIKSLSKTNEIYKEWCKEEGNGGRYSMWSYEDRWGRLFNRMYKIGLLTMCDKTEWKQMPSQRRYRLNIDSDKIKNIQKELFTKYL